jgi:hypothetical protein
MILTTDPQKAASVEAMLTNFFGENCGHRSKERVSISWSQPHELLHFGCLKRPCCHKMMKQSAEKVPSTSKECQNISNLNKICITSSVLLHY